MKHSKQRWVVMKDGLYLGGQKGKGSYYKYWTEKLEEAVIYKRKCSATIAARSTGATHLRTVVETIEEMPGDEELA